MPAVCDCFPELKSVTAAREARYRSDPGKPAPEGPQSSLEIKVTSIGNLNERVETRNSGRHFIISEPKHVGGLADAGCVQSPTREPRSSRRRRDRRTLELGPWPRAHATPARSC